jgi:hypothetical protein
VPPLRVETAMTRTLAILSALVLPGAPAPKPELPYYPTQVGLKSVYLNRRTGEEDTRVVASVTWEGGQTVVCTSRCDPGVQDVPFEKVLVLEKVLVSEKGIYCIETLTYPLDPPICLLKLPHKKDEIWEIQLPSPASTKVTPGKSTAGGTEQVVVPAGEFKALRVDVTWNPSGGTPVKETHWYARGVGLVKVVAHGRGETVLKSFTPAKPD